MRRYLKRMNVVKRNNHYVGHYFAGNIVLWVNFDQILDALSTNFYVFLPKTGFIPEFQVDFD